MKRNYNTNRIFKKMILTISFFLISFFTITPVNAASFRYSEFNWDKFAEKNKKYWLTNCETVDNKEKCEDLILTQQKKFYTKLYKLLAKYERKGVVGLNDNIIISTIFFEIPLGYVVDDDGKNSKDYAKITNSNATSYANDNGDVDNYDVEANDSDALSKGTDTLKLLVKSMVGYRASCYGIDNATKTTSDEGSVSYTCPNGSEINQDTGKCYTLLNSGDTHLGYWEKALENLQSFFGLTSNKGSECSSEAIKQGYSSYSYEVSNTLEKAEDKYWEFLTNSNYLDGIEHLKYRFRNKLKETKKDSLTEEEKIEVRTQIVKEIKELVKMYESSDSMYNANYETVTEYNYFFPIGSTETDEINGHLYAKKDPKSTTIISNFGEIKSQDGNRKKKNFGIDIGDLGLSGETNVIAIERGTVITVKNNCTEGEENSKTCNSGYGNMIMINHSDGNISVYAFLAPNSITVEEGDVVEQGQVIAKAGQTGDTDKVALHFEIRTSKSTASAVDPMDYLDLSNPRPTSSSKIAAFLEYLEGTGPMKDGNYVVYCYSGDIPTVGHGITLQNNVAALAQFGINVSSPYDKYCGTVYPKDTIDKVFGVVLKRFQDNVRNSLASHGVSNLANHQIDALTSLMYNTGNLDGFYSAYRTYQTSESLCTNYWYSHYVNAGTQYETGLRRRRKAECKLFVHGDYGL